MNRSIFLFLSFLVSNFYGLLFSQTGTLFTTDNVLSNSHINYILQDSRKYIWIATENGLNKYDGNRFTIYLNDKDDNKSLLNNYVRTIFEDSKGRLWVGCLNGLMLYNRAEDNFSEIPVYYKNQTYHPHITSIIELPSGEIVVATSGTGLLRSSADFKSFKVDENLFPILCSRYLTTVYYDKSGNLWIGSENQGLNTILNKSGKIVTYKELQSETSNQISAITGDDQGNIYVGTINGGLYRFDNTKRQFVHVPYIGVDGFSLPVKSLYFDKNKHLLVGTDGRGIKYFNPKNSGLEDYRLNTSMFDFLLTKVHAILQDNAGNLWLGLFQRGVFFSPNHPDHFEYIGNKSFYRNLIGSNCVMSVYKDNDNALWVGTDNDGLYKLSGNNSSHYALKSKSNGVSTTIMSILETDKNTLWLASYLDGLLQFDKKSGKVTPFANPYMIQNKASSMNKSMCMTPDRKNNIWIGTNGAGIQVFSSVEKRWVSHYQFNEADSTGIANNWVNCIVADKEGMIWAGTYEGVSAINPRNGAIKNFRVSANGLPGNVVVSLLIDSKNTIWFGTTNGLASYNRKTSEWVRYSKKDGLADNVICAIQEDNNGKIWVSTFNGISRVDPSKRSFVNFYASDGLQGNEFSNGASVKTPQGTLIFGGVGGVTLFNPDNVNHRKLPMICSLTGIYVFDRQVVKGEKSGLYTICDDFVADAAKIDLSYKDNMLSFEFSTFDFVNSQNIRYQYMLEGLHSKWVTTDKGVNKIIFNSLEYGNYKLRVKALLNNRESKERILLITIHPPFYWTLPAKLLYLILIALLGWLVYRIITDRMKNKQELIRREHLEQVNEGKLQFFINISHEIRTPMSLIISPLEKLLLENKDNDKQAVYQLMYRNSQRILRLINQLLDIRKIDKGQMFIKMSETDIVAFIDDLITTFEYQAKKQSIRLEFVHQLEKLNVWIDINNFDKVLVNILSNAFKFTPDNGSITVALRTFNSKNEHSLEHDMFEITVTDTGIGLEEGKMERIFERFYQIDNSLTQVNFGTGIGLHLAKSLVELMHGRLFARNRDDVSGSEFIIRMPLGKDHLSETEYALDNVHVQLHNSEMIEITDTRESVKPNARPKTKYRLLIVDDEVEIRHYLADELGTVYRISECANGKDALEYIRQHKPDLVISDVMMPEMDGISLCKKIKSNQNTKHIPVILLTAKSGDSDKAEGYEIGADAYVAKPFNVELLKTRIQSMLANRERIVPKAMDSEDNQAKITNVVLKPHDQILLDKIIKIVNENISESELNVEMLADGVGMSRVHMHRKLKELTNMSARDFIKSIRLKQAAELLSKNKLTISEVCYALGFTNLSHFSTVFREFYGMSPKEYMLKNSENTD